MKLTIAQKIESEMQVKGYIMVGKTSGWCTTRKGSNLNALLTRLGLLDTVLTENKMITDGDTIQRTVVIVCGAKKQHATEGTDLYVYKLA